MSGGGIHFFNLLHFFTFHVNLCRFGLPTRDSRKDILSLHTKTWNPPIDEGLVDALADKSIGYSGADLKGLCAEAALNALRRRYPQVYMTNQVIFFLFFDQSFIILKNYILYTFFDLIYFRN